MGLIFRFVWFVAVRVCDILRVQVARLCGWYLRDPWFSACEDCIDDKCDCREPSCLYCENGWACDCGGAQ